MLSQLHTVLTHSYTIEPLVPIDDPLVSIAITERKKGLTPSAFVRFKTDIIETQGRGP